MEEAEVEEVEVVEEAVVEEAAGLLEQEQEEAGLHPSLPAGNIRSHPEWYQ